MRPVVKVGDRDLCMSRFAVGVEGREGEEKEKECHAVTRKRVG